MSDRIKFYFAVFFFLVALILPGVGLVVYFGGSVLGQFDFSVGNLVWISVGMAVIFVVFAAIAGFILLNIEDHSWFTVSMPYLTGVLYTILPDFIPLSIDDGAATTAGAIFTFVLALQKNPNTPKWVFLPLVGAAIYAFFGGAFPGPIDELIVDGVAFFIAIYGMRSAPEDEDVIEGEVVEVVPLLEEKQPEG